MSAGSRPCRPHRPLTPARISAGLSVLLPLTLALVFATPASLAAQTNDVYFRAWDWRPDLMSARALALAGATVALADDASGLDVNPATLASLERSEVTASVATRNSGRTRAGDTLATRTGLAQVGVALRLSERWCVGGFFLEPQATHLELAAGPESDTGHDAGSLDAVTTDVGGALALRLSRRLHAGVRVGATRLSLEGEYRRVAGDDDAWLRVGAGGGPTAVTATAGVLLELGDSLRLGAAFTPETSWEFRRTAVSPRLGLNLDSGSTFAIRRPSVLAMGFSWHASRRLHALAQVDGLRAGPLPAGFPGGYRELPHLRSAWHTRVGLEYSWPFRSVALQARAGVESSRPHARAQPVRAPGPEDALADGSGVHVQLFQELDLATDLWQREPESSFGLQADDNDAVSAGLALVTRFSLRIDAATRVGRRHALFALGLSLRL